ncbi:MAG: penicillin acylase family protein [Saprospiraceae bacterium]|nr:penicillin acylase family protein [Saprospiraceae bacterium]
MKRLWSVVLPALLLTGYVFLLHRPIATSGGTLPPIGKFFNPFSGFWQNAEAIDGFKEEELKLPGLHAPVSIVYDERLVPHIFASNEEDAVMTQGYLHAKYRLWQMDITARQSAGRLAEIFGQRLLAHDQRMRRMGLSNTARLYATNWKKCQEYNLIENYTKGINSFIEGLKYAEYPLEFKLFNYAPEPWSVEKTALVVMSMNLMLCSRNEDLMATNALNYLGQEKFKFLFPRWNPNQSPVIPKGTVWSIKKSLQDLDTNPSIGYFTEEMINDYPRSIGSNNWAVSAEKTEDGNPILCNDPHLSLTLPSIWYEMQMKTDTYNAYGVSLPGIPYVAIGFNDEVAWGETNVGMDVSDFYEIEWIDSSKTSYRVDGKVETIKFQIEEYQTQGGKIIYDTIKLTKWGPVFLEESRSLALQWLPNEAIDNCIVGTFRKLNQSQNFSDYYDALRGFISPAQNFIYASIDGDVALKVQGAMPIKGEDEGQFILTGKTSKNDWNGYIPFDETPFIKNPDRGFVSSANQQSTDSDYPYKYHGYFEDYRGRTLNQQLGSNNKITVEDMQSLQNSTFDLLAAELCPILLNHLDKSAASNLWSSALSDWNYYYESGARQPIIFETWKNEFYNLVWDEFSNEEEKMSIKLLRPEMWRTISLATEDPENIFFDLIQTPEVETLKDVVAMSFGNTTVICDSIFASDPNLTWKDFRHVSINHLSRVPAFSVTGIDVGGVGTAINAVKENHGPSWRMVVKLSKPLQAWGIYPGGQSGNPGSAFYKNMIHDWSQGNYYTLHHASSPGDLTNFQLGTTTLNP